MHERDLHSIRVRLAIYLRTFDLSLCTVIAGCNFVELSLKGREVIGPEEAAKLNRRLKETERQLKCLENVSITCSYM